MDAARRKLVLDKLMEDAMAKAPPEKQAALKLLMGGKSLPHGSADVARALEQVTASAQAAAVAQHATSQVADLSARLTRTEAALASLTARVDAGQAQLDSLPALVSGHVDALFK